MPRVLILCTGNSCRSQIAQAFWESLGGGQWEVESAGSRPSGYVHPLAIRVMQELGIDMSANTSKALDVFVYEAFDLIVTVCDNARESCPVFSGAKARVHWPFDDPAVVTGTEEKQMIAFRRVRDAIKDQVDTFLASRPATIAHGDSPENAST